MGIFKRKPETETRQTLLFLADAEELAGRQVRRDPARSDADEQDARGMDRQAARLRRRAERTRKGGV